MRRPSILLAIAVALTLLAAGIFVGAQSRTETAAAGALRAGAFEPPRAAPELGLTGSNGAEVTIADHRGKVVLLTFGFTSCAAVCPTTMSTLAQARKALGKAGDRVQVVFVTVDPDRDDAAALSRYMAAFDPTFIGATGTAERLAEVRRNYGVTAVREGSGPDYAMAHTSSIFLIDHEGRLRGMMPYGRDAADYVHDIRLLLDA